MRTKALGFDAFNRSPGCQLVRLWRSTVLFRFRLPYIISAKFHGRIRPRCVADMIYGLSPPRVFCPRAPSYESRVPSSFVPIPRLYLFRFLFQALHFFQARVLFPGNLLSVVPIFIRVPRSESRVPRLLSSCPELRVPSPVVFRPSSWPQGKKVLFLSPVPGASFLPDSGSFPR